MRTGYYVPTLGWRLYSKRIRLSIRHFEDVRLNSGALPGSPICKESNETGNTYGRQNAHCKYQNVDGPFDAAASRVQVGGSDPSVGDV